MKAIQTALAKANLVVAGERAQEAPTKTSHLQPIERTIWK